MVNERHAKDNIYRSVWQSRLVRASDSHVSQGTTWSLDSQSLRRLTYQKMSFAKRVLSAVVAVALSAYASDCFAMATPEQAMQCCKSMGCASHSRHGQDCCQTMRTMHAAFGQPSSVQGVSFSPVLLGLVPAFDASGRMESAVRWIAEHSHAPPISCSPVILPLRI